MNHVIILAAGKGKRFNPKKDKMLVPVAGKPLIYYSLMAFNDHPDISTITVVCSKENKEAINEIIKNYEFIRVKKVKSGSDTRQKSLENGLKSVETAEKDSLKKDDIILVHNAANPLPSHEEITEAIVEAQEHGACITGRFPTSTMKEVDGSHIVKTHDRELMFAAETPQAVKYGLLDRAIKNAKKKNIEATDEAMLLEAIGQKVKYVEASENNFKITTKADYARLATVLGELPENFIVGLGQDSHMFSEEEMGLTLGGLFLKDEKKLDANSDGDVIMHAIFNAMSQAIGEMSLGFYADSECEKGVKDSAKYLDIIMKKAKKQKYTINSLGLMIECKTPKVDPLVSKIKKSLSAITGLNSRRIGITATTGEKCTVFGEGMGIQCFAIVSFIKG